MRVGFRNIQRFLEGGPMPPQGAPAPEEGGAPQELGAPQEQGGDPLLQLGQMFMQALQAQDCNMCFQAAEAFILLIQQAQGGPADQGGAPEGAPAPEGEPVFRAGGRLAYRIKK